MESDRVMKMKTILFKNEQDSQRLKESRPEFFADLNLDQVVDWITKNKEDYRLTPFLYTPLEELDAIVYRQEVFRDLEDKGLLENLESFAKYMIVVRRYLGVAKERHYENNKMGWHLEAALVYCDAVHKLVETLTQADLQSEGLIGCVKQFEDYVQSESFIQFERTSRDLKSELSSIEYNVIIRDNWVRVRKYNSEKDYSREVNKFFSKFEEDEVKDFRVDLAVPTGMNHVEGKILDLVAKLFPREFDHLKDYYHQYENFLDEAIATFDREIQFYFAYITFMERIENFGLRFCYPQLGVNDKTIHACDTFDIALAEIHRREDLAIVGNDFHLEGSERIIVVTGPNQGGKTTFARMFAQLHYLACLGCPIPGSEAKLLVFDQIYTHFEREEEIQNLRGKLKDDLVRIQKIIEAASDKSIIIMNEIFTSTALEDAIYLSEIILKKIIELDALGVCVTFIDELSTLGEQTISMVSTVDPDNPAERTFKIIRKPADGRAYAIHVAKHHRLTQDLIKERIEQ